MTTGKKSKRSKRSQSVKSSKSVKHSFLDTSGGFYGRLEEPDSLNGNVRQVARCDSVKSDSGIVHFQREAMDDNGESPLITRKSKTCKKIKKNKERRSLRNVNRGNSSSFIRNPSISVSSECEQVGTHDGLEHPYSIHSPIPDEDLVLIEAAVYDGKEVNKMKQLKGSKMKYYRRTIDRAFRHGWETFLANLNSVTIT